MDECESTQLLIAADATEGTVALADFQSAGRGRLGRTLGGPARARAIHASIALRPPGGRPPPELTLVGALAAADAVEVATDLFVQVKWPNDVMLNRRKVAGVLGELARRHRRPRDRNQRQPDARAASARRAPTGRLAPHDHGREHDRGELLVDRFSFGSSTTTTCGSSPA